MKIEKFKFIELPRPEVTISEFGMSEILGGTLCTHYIVCVGTSSDKNMMEPAILEVTARIWIVMAIRLVAKEGYSAQVISSPV